MPLIEARGVTFHAQELGPTTAKSDRASAVMLHGLFVGSLASWFFTTAPSLAKERRVLLYDLRGHGKSDRTKTGYDVATMTADLEALAARFDDRPLDITGHSFGALVALRFALDHPSRVRRLVLVEAPLPPSRFGELETFAARTPEEMIAALPNALRDAVAAGGRRASRLVESLRFLAAESTLFADLRREPDVSDAELARIACPVLCVYGDRSPCLPTGERISRAIPGSRLRVLPGGHYLHVDASAALTSAIVEHFDG